MAKMKMMNTENPAPVVGLNFFEIIGATMLEAVLNWFQRAVQVVNFLFNFEVVGHLMVELVSAIFKWPIIIFRNKAAIFTQLLVRISQITMSNFIITVGLAFTIGWFVLDLSFLPINLNFTLKARITQGIYPLFVDELVPLVLALLIAIRSGTAESITLAIMKVNQEIPQLAEIKDEDIVRIFISRMIALTLSFLLLAIIFIYVLFSTHRGLSGGSLGLGFLSDFKFYLNIRTNGAWILQEVSPGVIRLGFFKSFIFSLLIFFWSVYFGLKAQKLTDIAKNAGRGAVFAVVTCAAANIGLDYLLK
jgi:ABC-type transporter Mla maintaining outer membrane lipid asymmetry permease subunit MlaE